MVEINIAEDEVNTGRQSEFDYVKAIAILGMIAIHIYEEMSVADCSLPVTDFLNGFIQFIGGPLAAPVFTFAMGVGIAYSRNNDPDSLIKRGIKLFLGGYLLTICHDAIPECIFNHQIVFDDNLIYNIFYVDILQMDGLAFILIGLLRKMKVSDIATLCIGLVMQAIGFLLIPYISVPSTLGRCLLGLFVYTGEESYFPLTLWFVYVIAGLVFGEIIRHATKLSSMYRRMLIFCPVALFCLCVSLYAMGYDLRELYSLAGEAHYKQNSIKFIFNMLVIGTEASIGYYILRNIPINSFGRWVKVLSSNLNPLYITQWLLIGWTTRIFFVAMGLEKISVGWVIPVALVYFVASVVLVKAYYTIKTNINRNKTSRGQ